MINYSSSRNCSTELRYANLEVKMLGKQGTLQTLTLNYFACPPRKAGKTDTIFMATASHGGKAIVLSCSVSVKIDYE